MKKLTVFRDVSRFSGRTVDDFRPAGANFGYIPRSASVQVRRTLWLPLVMSLLIFSPAMAEVRQDAWVGMDKANHFGVSAPLGMFGATMAGKSADSADQVLYGTLIGALPGLAKELYDVGHPGSNASIKDMAWNLLGAAAGSMSSRWFSIMPMSYRDRVDGLRVQIRFDF